MNSGSKKLPAELWSDFGGTEKCEYMKREFYLPLLTPEKGQKLCEGLDRRFRYGLKIEFNEQHYLSIEMAPMHRNLYPDESCEARPHALGNPVSIDSIRWEQISCYVNGFYENI